MLCPEQWFSELDVADISVRSPQTLFAFNITIFFRMKVSDQHWIHYFGNLLSAVIVFSKLYVHAFLKYFDAGYYPFLQWI